MKLAIAALLAGSVFMLKDMHVIFAFALLVFSSVEAAKVVVIKPVKIRLFGTPQDNDGKDEIDIAMYGRGPKDCFDCAWYRNKNEIDICKKQILLTQKLLGYNYVCLKYANITDAGTFDLEEVADALSVDMSELMSNLRKSEIMYEEKKTLWPYYRITKQLEIKKDEEFDININDSWGGIAQNNRPVTIKLQEKDWWDNEYTDSVLISRDRINEMYLFFESMDDISKDLNDTEGVVSDFEMTYAFGFDEQPPIAELLYESGLPQWMVDTVIDQLCISSLDIALEIGGPVIKTLGKGAMKAGYKLAKAQNLDDAASGIKMLDSAGVGSKLSEKATEKTLGLFQKLQACVVDIMDIFDDGSDGAHYEVTFKVFYVDKANHTRPSSSSSTIHCMTALLIVCAILFFA